ncbi:hypothetical protein J6590_001846 [Homalodisca vitripennis]|nr:hypothetical protein J6590_001846 [Homalodisca vitripennis]
MGPNYTFLGSTQYPPSPQHATPSHSTRRVITGCRLCHSNPLQSASPCRLTSLNPLSTRIPLPGFVIAISETFTVTRREAFVSPIKLQ